MNLIEFTKIANHLIDILANIHKQGQVVGALNPEMISIDPETLDVKFTGKPLPMPLNPEYLYQYPEYIAPEQTGRLNIPVDYRTDFYCLGIILYKMLSGQLPFQAEDPLETIYYQIAATPAKIKQVPEALSQIILKLLSKDPEERYQSIKGLKADLNRAVHNEVFELGKEDISPFFHIPEKVYGRDKEKEILEQVYNQTCENKVQLLLVSGYSGIGKTVLVREIQPYVVRNKGLFISGKYDLLRRSTAYSAITEALDQLCKILLSEPKESVDKWKAKILDIVGQNGCILTDIIPKLELIIGKQPELPEMDTQARQNLFNITLIRFIGLFTQEEYSLVMFLDDLQWVDIPSLNIIKSIVSFQPNQKFMIIGAYRSNEVDATHPLNNFIESFEKENIQTTRIELGPLKEQYIEELCSESFMKPLNQVADLTKILKEKTGGNPFFLKAFLKNMYDTGFITFTEKTGWQWSIKEIRAQEVTENVAVLVSSIINRFGDKTRKLIIEGSFLGNIFRIIDLQVIVGLDENEIKDSIQPAVSAGILLAQDVTYKFAHDKFQETAYSLVEKSNLPEKHLKIARLLYESFQKERLFDIVQQYNRVIYFITSKKEFLLIVRLNLDAAVKAKESQAYNVGVGYLDIVMNIFSENKLDSERLWKQDYDLMFKIYKEYAELLYLNQKYDESEAVIKEAMLHTKNVLDKSEFKKLFIAQSATNGQYHRCVNIGIETLKELGINFPEKNYEENFKEELEWHTKYMKNRSVFSILDLPEANAPIILMALKILDSISVPAYLYDITIWKYIMTKAVNLSLQYGITVEFSSCIVWFATIHNSIYQQYNKAYEYGKVALELSTKAGNLFQTGRNLMVISCFLEIWTKHLSNSLRSIEEGYNYSYKVGDLEYVGYSLGNFPVLELISFVPLQEILKKTQERLILLKKLKNITVWVFMTFIFMVINNLTGNTASRNTFSYFEMDDETFIRKYKEEIFIAGNMSLIEYLVFKAQALYYYEDYKNALKTSKKAENLALFMEATVEFEFVFYQVLILIALYPKRSRTTRLKYKKIIEKHLKQYEIWNSYCPDNFEHRYLLIRAEYEHKILGKEGVSRYYKTAIENARRTGFMQIEALANELYAKYWLARDDKEIAQLYFFRARDLYNKWGAKRKVECLEEFYRDIYTMPTVYPGKPLVSPAVMIDYETVLNTSYALAEELDLETLIKKMISILSKNAGAQYTVIILPENENIYKIVVFEKETKILTIENKDITAYLPKSLFHYIQHSAEPMILNDVKKNSNYSQDPYFFQHRAKSALALPIKKGETVYGIIYFENHKIINAFDEQRVELLKTLLIQAAISIENAKSQEHLAEKAKQETLLREIISEIKLTRDLDDAYQRLLKKLAEVFNLNRVLFLESSPVNPDELFVKYEYISENVSLSNFVFPQICIDEFLKLIERMEPLVVNNIIECGYEHNQEAIDFLREHKINALLTIPLVKYDREIKVLGFIVLCSENSRIWTTQEIDLIKAISESIVSIIWEISKFIEIENLRNSFISTLTHDFQIPLIGEKTALEYLSIYMEKNLETSKELIAELFQSNLHITSLLNKSIDIYNYESGKKELVFSSEKVFEILKNSIRLVKSFADSKYIEIKTYWPDKNLLIKADKKELIKVFNSILENAIEHSPENSKIHIGAYKKEDKVIIYIKDHGAGIPDDVRERIFKRYEMATALERKIGGGTGLLLAKYIVESHNGSIWFISVLNKGTVFYVSLPLFYDSNLESRTSF